ncbi:MAG: hypothetical protein M1274_08005 [Actinobacteria bacterium]|nr:hypothetical protein [Actinomycetota bacterium]
MARQNRSWLAILAASLVAASAAVYAIHYAIFRDSHHIFLYLVGDIAFLPLEVLIVGLFIERIITLREKRALAHKLNMVIGAFFSELGTPLLAELLPALAASGEIRQRLHLEASWNKEDFSRASRFAHDLTCAVDLGPVDLTVLRTHLVDHRQFILRLLENPNLMEHDRFTDLLWAVLHLEEELEARTSLKDLRPADQAHLENDIRRAFTRLLAEWVLYVGHLKENYPYLFSLVARIHPFQDTPSAEVTSG